jgi:hypothetical protein
MPRGGWASARRGDRCTRVFCPKIVLHPCDRAPLRRSLSRPVLCISDECGEISVRVQEGPPRQFRARRSAADRDREMVGISPSQNASQCLSISGSRGNPTVAGSCAMMPSRRERAVGGCTEGAGPTGGTHRPGGRDLSGSFPIDPWGIDQGRITRSPAAVPESGVAVSEEPRTKGAPKLRPADLRWLSAPVPSRSGFHCIENTGARLPA